MSMTRAQFDKVFFGTDRLLPYATDCPVRYEVWLAYAQSSDDTARHDVILHANQASGETNPGDLARWLYDFLGPEVVVASRMAFSGDFIALRLTFAELLSRIIPFTSLAPLVAQLKEALGRPVLLSAALRGESIETVRAGIREADSRSRTRELESWDHFVWFTRLAAAVVMRSFNVEFDEVPPRFFNIFNGVPSVGHGASDELEGPRTAAIGDGDFPIEQVTLNRRATATVSSSRKTVKCDAAERVFGVSCKDITWAVFDSGIDATHPAFALRAPDGSAEPTVSPDGVINSRVTATFDFTELRRHLATGGTTRLDWETLQQRIRVPHRNSSMSSDEKVYARPIDDHGTHVAGILGANWPEEDLVGVCPDIRLWDMRVLDDEGKGDEFNIVAALQFVRWINDNSSRQVVAGINLSLSLPHEVANYSCGWTPVCVECDRLVRAGVVVVTVAGNRAFDGGPTASHADGASYRAISITDPGNGEAVITVGSTHRTDPHRHGVSYFSGRGPTADGRRKPDLLAPGERIDGPVPDEGLKRLSGTSQSCPHVSGAAAMLLARHRELLGRPERVKEILCASATSLGREPSFQGSGILDVLRAMQSL